VARGDADFFPLMVLDLLFGGTFMSRLNQNLRERNGFTYGVRSRFSFRTRPGPFQISTAVGADVTSAAVHEIVSELERLVADGPGEEEVAASRDYAAGVFPLRLETSGQVAGRITELVIYGLADDYHHTYRDRVRGVTAVAAGAAGARHLHPSQAQIVVVGDASGIAPGLEGLGLGPVEVERPEGR
jgi:predicted Zn-dependent peptidase